MVTPKAAESFISAYENNEKKLREWNARLFEEQEPAEWIRMLSKRSRDVRRIFNENVAALDNFRALLPREDEVKNLSKADADILCNVVQELYTKGFHDFYILTELSKTILPIYENSDDYGRTVFLSHVIGYEYAYFYRYDPDKDLSDSTLYFRKAVSYAPRYSEIESTFYKSFILKDYANLLFATKRSFCGFPEDPTALCEEALSFFVSPAVSADTELLPLRDDLLNTFKTSLMSYYVFKHRLTDEDLATIERLMINAGEFSHSSDEIADAISDEYRSFLRGNISLEETVKELVDKLVSARPHPDCSKKDPDDLTALSSYFENVTEILNLIGLSDISPEAKADLSAMLKYSMRAFLKEIPYNYYPETVNPLISQMYKLFKQYFVTEEESVTDIIEYVIKRQPLTYIHSVMVSKIAAILTRAALREMPDNFKNIPVFSEYETKGSFDDKVVDYMQTAALLHDIGKCQMTEIINRQGRKLSSDEFAILKRHPELGKEMIDHPKDLHKYMPLIEGHHKFHDGSAGYPDDFDIVNCPSRFLIDILSIADSIDAATDSLSKNYSEGKDFASLLKELSEAKGTRYNADIVRMIETGEELKNELICVTSSGRFDTYYKAYNEIIKQGTV